MAKTFRAYVPEQELLLPPSLRDWLPDDHLAFFVNDLVDALDLSAITAVYEREDRGQPPYHPALMVKLLVYAYCMGKPSSRQIERATYEEIPYRVLAANQHPDHDTLAVFRQTHLAALARALGLPWLVVRDGGECVGQWGEPLGQAEEVAAGALRVASRAPLSALELAVLGLLARHLAARRAQPAAPGAADVAPLEMIKPAK